MIRKLRNSFGLKVIALTLLISLVLPWAKPLRVFALTGGPPQPEYEGFEQAGASDLVNLFSGDFTYNLPLLTVPGPNGGYPINIAYHSGINMEQEAGWVGLGWTLSAGSVNRDMRGIPDDFKGDEIKSKLYFKPDVTVGIGAGVEFPEIFGADTKKISGNLELSYKFLWNSYHGISSTLGVGLTATMGHKGKFNSEIGLNFEFSSSEGATFSPSISMELETGLYKQALDADLTYSSREGLEDIGMTYRISKFFGKTHRNEEGELERESGWDVPVGIGVKSLSNGCIPNLGSDLNGMSGAFSVSL
jgi:hypothetical protein